MIYIYIYNFKWEGSSEPLEEHVMAPLEIIIELLSYWISKDKLILLYFDKNSYAHFEGVNGNLLKINEKTMYSK